MNTNRPEARASTVLDSLRNRFQPIVTSLLEKHDPELLAAFRVQDKPTLDQQEAMIDVVGDAFSEHFGPGHEPTEQGKLIDDALGAFLTRWPSEDLTED
ncbi:hypothetical protein ATK30_8269 [Amycolatopsis echigonensis]|uniref:Uncharacterized protein n=1 Tax=Amycolatopsis echigonensis TaxID=2576905 RepID=A0A2N3WTV0_9PSEU|nr:hypothetical protein ATK30_8269 [Amycolatopsis niigatensis]